MRARSDRSAPTRPAFFWPVILAAGGVAVLFAAGACRVKTGEEPARPPGQPDANEAGGSAAQPATGPAAQADAPASASASASGSIKMIYERAPGSFASLVAAHQGAVVNIRTTRKVKGGPAAVYPGAAPDESLGSGFVVRHDGTILTGLAVVASAAELRVATADGEEYPAALVGTDPHLEVALLRAEGLPARTPIVELDDSEALEVGQWVVALGSPFAGEITANPGAITGLGKRREIANPPGEKYRGYIQTSAIIHAGNAGGPLLDAGGNVIGLCHAVASGGSLIGFAVPASEIARVMERLERGTVSRAWLGLRFLPVTQAQARAAGLDGPRGAYVSEVRAGQPADRAGIRQGDILLGFDRSDVTADNLPGLLYRVEPGQAVEVVLWRGSGEVKVTVTTGKLLE